MDSHSKLQFIEEKYKELEDQYTRALGRKEQIEKNIVNIQEEIEKIDSELEKLEKVDSLFKLTGEYARNQSKKQIEMIVSNCLSMIFEKNLNFEIELKELRNKTSAEFYIKEEEIENKYNIVDTRGGGVVDIVSLSLRIAFLLKYKPSIEGPLILDEPAKHVSIDYIYNVADFLKKISADFNRQIILISHDEHLLAMANTSYRVEKREGESLVEKEVLGDR